MVYTIKLLKILLFFIVGGLTLNNNIICYSLEILEINSESYILMEASTGKILHVNNGNEPMYPASTTKILTSLVTLEYLEKDEILTVGNEIYTVPFDSSLAGNTVGENILVENAIRGLLIKSGNETATILARATVEKLEGKEITDYSFIEEEFSKLMNQKAIELGAINSNFVNPHGYHDDRHYTTALDLALITKEFLKNDFLIQISAENIFEGNGLGDRYTAELNSNNYLWENHNLLLREGDYFYEYAIGVKTGFTNLAGDCLVAAAEKDGVTLIAVLLNSSDNSRFNDAIKLFDYGFNTFEFKDIVEEYEVLDKLILDKLRIGENDTLNLLSGSTYEEYISEEELLNKTFELNYNTDILEILENGNLKVKENIIKGDVLGTYKFLINDAPIYEGELISDRDVLPRDLKSDLIYYSQEKNVLITTGIVLLVGVILVSIILINRATKKRDVYRFKKRNR